MIDLEKINTDKILSMLISMRMGHDTAVEANHQIFMSEFFGEESEINNQFELYEMQMQSPEIQTKLAQAEFINMLEYTCDLIWWTPGLISEEEYEVSCRKQTYQVFKNYAQYMLDSLAPIFFALETVDPQGEIKNAIMPVIRNYQDLFYEAERKSGHKADLYNKRCQYLSGKIQPILNKIVLVIEQILEKVFLISKCKTGAK